MTAQYLYAIAIAIQNLKFPDNGGSAQCCANVVAAIGGVSSTLAVIATELPKLSLGGPPPDLTAVVTELTCLCESLKAIAAAPGPDFTTVVQALDEIRDAINRAGADPNLKRIADVVNGIDPDSPEAVALFDNFLQLVVDKYGFPAELAQLLTS